MFFNSFNVFLLEEFIKCAKILVVGGKNIENQSIQLLALAYLEMVVRIIGQMCQSRLMTKLTHNGKSIC